MNVGSWVLIHAMHEYQAKMINQWEALINFLREKERKTRRREKRNEKEKRSWVCSPVC